MILSSAGDAYDIARDTGEERFLRELACIILEYEEFPYVQMKRKTEEARLGTGEEESNEDKNPVWFPKWIQGLRPKKVGQPYAVSENIGMSKRMKLHMSKEIQEAKETMERRMQAMDDTIKARILEMDRKLDKLLAAQGL